jgi:hypothetical protein
MKSATDRPGSYEPIPVSEEVEELVRQRLSEIENDEKSTRPWSEIKARILHEPNSR